MFPAYKRGFEPRSLSLKASWLTFEPSRNHLTWLRLKERTSWQDTWLFWSPGNSRNPDREGVALKSKLEPSTQTWRPQIRIFFNNESEKRQPESQFDVSDRVIFRSDNGKTNSAKKNWVAPIFLDRLPASNMTLKGLVVVKWSTWQAQALGLIPAACWTNEKLSMKVLSDVGKTGENVGRRFRCCWLCILVLSLGFHLSVASVHQSQSMIWSLTYLRLS